MDLDIHNYNIKEIKDLLQLKKSYTVDDVDFNSYDFIKKVKSRKNIKDDKKKEIESFIKLCVKMLKDDLEKKKFKKMLEESKFKSILKNQDKIIQNQYNLAEGLKKLNDKIEVLLENSNKKKIEL